MSTKPAKTIDEQLSIYKTRKLIVDDDEKVLSFLKYNNYYRFSGYTKAYSAINNDFVNDVTFDDIYNAYDFDFKLRSLLNKYIERIEVFYKSLLANSMSVIYDPLFYKDETYFSFSKDEYDEFIGKINNDIVKMSKREEYATHFGDEMPIWALVELISFGSMSKFYSSLQPAFLNDLVSKIRKLDLERIISGLRAMTLIRNICCHRARLFNKGFTNAPKLANKTVKVLCVNGNPQRNNRSLFCYCCCLLDLLNSYEEGEHFINELSDLFDDAPKSVDLYTHYGFIGNWKNVLYQINLFYK